jgi:trehalose utilization protein
MLAMSAAVAGAMLVGCQHEAGPGMGGGRRRVVIWSEGKAPKELYPKDINGAIAEGLKPLKGWEIMPVTYSAERAALTEELLNKTDVLIWWGKWHHQDVPDAMVDVMVRRVKEGKMGFICIHSGHAGKPFKKLMGTGAAWKSGAIDDSALKVIVKEAGHPIARGGRDFVIDKSERYTEPFDVPVPEAVPFDGEFTLPDGSHETSRQGLCWTIGKGRVFYFQPGHETYGNFHQKEVQRILRNAVEWAGAAQA